MKLCPREDQSRQGNLPQNPQTAHQALYHQLLEQAATLGYLYGFRVMALLLFITVPFVWIMKKPQFKSQVEGTA